MKGYFIVSQSRGRPRAYHDSDECGMLKLTPRKVKQITKEGAELRGLSLCGKCKTRK